MGYDARGALASVALPAGTTITYAIDPSGRRVGKSVNGVFEGGWLYQDRLNPIAELDASGAIRALFVYGSRPHVPDYMVMGGETYRLVTDIRGSVRLVVSTTTGAVAQRIDYDPWGRVLADSSPGLQPFGFAGGLYDPDTGLVRFGARDYDPEVGRWTARDPLLFEDMQSNLYLYVADYPINSIDLTGNAAAAVGWVVVEAGLTFADIAACLETLFDPCASTFDKVTCVALTAGGMSLPAGGLAAAARTGQTAGDAVGLATRIENWVRRLFGKADAAELAAQRTRSEARARADRALDRAKAEMHKALDEREDLVRELWDDPKMRR